MYMRTFEKIVTGVMVCCMNYFHGGRRKDKCEEVEGGHLVKSNRVRLVNLFPIPNTVRYLGLLIPHGYDCTTLIETTRRSSSI
jgi:hypothetical protein